MGKRSRRRGDEPVRAPAPGAAKKPETFVDRFIAAGDQRPKAPWHPFPLVELCVLAGIVLIVFGLLNFEDRDGRTLLLMGFVLASLGGLDTAVRDHFAGFRSHTLLLAGVPTVLIAGGLFYARAPWPAVVAGALLFLFGGVWFFRQQFRAKSGGYSFKA
jgi:hypothetical protein